MNNTSVTSSGFIKYVSTATSSSLGIVEGGNNITIAYGRNSFSSNSNCKRERERERERERKKRERERRERETGKPAAKTSSQSATSLVERSFV